MVSGSPCRDIVFNGYVSYVLSYVCSIHASTPVRSSRKIVMEITTVARISSYTRLDSIFMNQCKAASSGLPAGDAAGCPDQPPRYNPVTGETLIIPGVVL